MPRVSSRSTSRTAATASWSGRTSRPWPTCGARRSCWPRTLRRSSSLLNALVNGGVQPGEVEFKYTQDAFQAAAAFNADKSIAGVVSWAPDIYNLSKVEGQPLLVTTATANKLIADVWFARADFAKDHPDIIEGLVRGIFDAMEALKDRTAKQQVAKLMATGYSIPATDALGMFGDAHSTNYAENREFFLNQNNPPTSSAPGTPRTISTRRSARSTSRSPFDQVMDFSVIQKLGRGAQVRQPEGRVPHPVRRPRPRRGAGRKRTRSSPRPS